MMLLTQTVLLQKNLEDARIYTAPLVLMVIFSILNLSILEQSVAQDAQLGMKETPQLTNANVSHTWWRVKLETLYQF